MLEGMITAKQARELTDACQDHFNIREVLFKLPLGKSHCEVFLGREITKKQAKERMQQFRDLGYYVYGYTVTTKVGGFREPERTIPAEHRCTISW